MPGIRSLPITVDSDHVKHAKHKVWSAWSWEASKYRIITFIGIFLALAGVWFSLSPNVVSVGVDSSGYRIGKSLLVPIGVGEYSGDAALVISKTGGITKASSEETYKGVHTTGVCLFSDNSLLENCTFVIGNKEVQATDKKVEGGWSRHYNNNQSDVTIQLDNGKAIPVPFPIGYQG
jgi:hypothetical protein